MPIAAGTLFRSPLEITSGAGQPERSEVKFHRAVASPEAKNLSGKFRLASRDFQRQYFHVYSRRLEAMRGRVEASTKGKLPGGDVSATPLCRLEEGEDSDVLIVGTLFKNQALKPNILLELSEQNGVPPQPPHLKFIADDDDVILEDDLQRIKLRGDVHVAGLVTGVVCGVYGRERESGKFEVKQFFFAAPPLQPERSLMKKDSYVVLMSGLELSDVSSSALSSLQLAADWICGEAGEMADQEASSLVQRVIIAGNSLSESTRDKEEMSKAKYLTKDVQARSIDAVNLLDGFLVQLAGSVDTDLMPGAFDPSSHILPQQPLHPCLFPLASVYPTLRTVSNPYLLELDGGLQMVGTSGQNTDDIIRNTDLDSPLDAMEALLRWSHLAPTCPDTLGCFPYRDSDPFIIDSRPHIMFTANQSKFEQRLFKEGDHEIKLLSIPKFVETSSIILLNLRTLEAEELKFVADFQ